MLTVYLVVTSLIWLLALVGVLGTKPGSPCKPNGSARFLMVTAVVQALLLATAIALLLKTWGVGL